MNLAYRKHERIWLRDHAEFNERWLHDRIQEDPGILGLGDLVLLDRERRQERAGRLDLLLIDPQEDLRFEVEVMLGQTDESHIIRCIEYWDIERRRYPGYEHTAVLVAEDVTTRFLNLLAIFAGTIPLVVIQLNALQVDDQILLDFIKVLDQRSLRRDDEVEGQLAAVDRSYWDDRAAAPIVTLTDQLLEIINEKADPKQQLKYNRYYIGLTDGVRVRNFVAFKPRKKYLHMWVEVEKPAEWVEPFEEIGLPASEEPEQLQLTLRPGDLKKSRDLLTELLHEAVEWHES